MSPYGTKDTPPGSGSNGERFDGWPVRASAPMVRPWKPPSAATSAGRPVRRAILKAASFASAPDDAKNTRPSRPVRASSRSASCNDGSLATRFDV